MEVLGLRFEAVGGAGEVFIFIGLERVLRQFRFRGWGSRFDKKSFKDNDYILDKGFEDKQQVFVEVSEVLAEFYLIEGLVLFLKSDV